VFNLKCPFAQRKPGCRLPRANSGRAADSDWPRRRAIPVPPPKVDHLGSLAVCWETEL
jgi:hypothetical protein